MPLETASTLDQLVTSNPSATDGAQQGDDHIRLIKSAVKGTFPNFTGALTATQTELDAAVTANKNGTNTFADGTESLPGAAFKDDTDTGFWRPDDNELAGSVGGHKFLQVTSDKKATFAADVETVGVHTAGSYAGGGGELVPLFVALPYFSNTLPSSKYCWANGGQLSRTNYAAAFAEWGTTYGAGDGTTTFNVPDLKERVPVGKSNMGGASVVGRISQYTLTALGTAIGVAKTTLTTAYLPLLGLVVNITDPGHKHRIAGATDSGTTGAPVAGNSTNDFSGGHETETKTTGISAAIPEIGSATPSAIDNVQPGLVCNYIIRVK